MRAKEWYLKHTLENNSSELEDGKIMQGTGEHAKRAKNNPLIKENPLIPLGEFI